MTATELLARPTYVEEFQNIRDNVNKAIKPREDNEPAEKDMIDDEWENISHYSKRKVSRERDRDMSNNSMVMSSNSSESSSKQRGKDVHLDLKPLDQVKEEDEASEMTPMVTASQRESLLRGDVPYDNQMKLPRPNRLKTEPSRRNQSTS